MTDISLSLKELRQALIEGFQAGFTSCFDLMEQEVSQIFSNLSANLSCPYCDDPLKQHQYSDNCGIYWSCPNHDVLAFSERLKGTLECPSCEATMFARMSFQDLSVSFLVWECIDCNAKLTFRLCPSCCTMLEKRLIPLNIRFASVDKDCYYCTKCNKNYGP